MKQGSMRVSELETMLARRGWRWVRTRGSHRHFRNDKGQRLSFAKAHGYLEPGTLKAIMKRLERLEQEMP